MLVPWSAPHCSPTSLLERVDQLDRQRIHRGFDDLITCRQVERRSAVAILL
jgi:Sulfatase-modifying factor enzyme 1